MIKYQLNLIYKYEGYESGYTHNFDNREDIEPFIDRHYRSKGYEVEYYILELEY